MVRHTTTRVFVVLAFQDNRQLTVQPCESGFRTADARMCRFRPVLRKAMAYLIQPLQRTRTSLMCRRTYHHCRFQSYPYQLILTYVKPCNMEVAQRDRVDQAPQGVTVYMYPAWKAEDSCFLSVFLECSTS